MAFPPDTPESEAAVARVHAEMKERGVSCGDCNLCCTVMRVDMEPVAEGFKEANVKCQHVCKAGCSIYQNKPASCNSFLCMWLGMRLFNEEFPMKWRPDKIGAVIDVNDFGTLTIHLKHDNAWKREGDLRDCILYFVDKFPHVILNRPTSDPLLFRTGGFTEELVSIGISERGLKTYRTKHAWEL